MERARYEPFVRGPHEVGAHTHRARDGARRRDFAVEVWSPANAEDVAHPLVLFSHGTGGGRCMASYLCTHLASHGYVVASMDHSERTAPELARKAEESAAERRARIAAWIAQRVPDVRFLLDAVLDGDLLGAGPRVDPGRVGIVGHSFGGWTALAATGSDPRIRAVVALAPGGSSSPKPGMIAAPLSFAWGRPVPALYLVGEDDVMTSLAGVRELLERTVPPKRMVVLRRADHEHFMDDAERMHELVRAAKWTGDLAWIPDEMRPITELCSGEAAHDFVRGLALAHFDATLRDDEGAAAFLRGDLASELGARGIEVQPT